MNIKIKNLLTDLMFVILLGLAISITTYSNNIRKENERIREDIKIKEWVKCAKIQPQNNMENGVENGSK